MYAQTASAMPRADRLTNAVRRAVERLLPWYDPENAEAHQYLGRARMDGVFPERDVGQHRALHADGPGYRRRGALE